MIYIIIFLIVLQQTIPLYPSICYSYKFSSAFSNNHNESSDVIGKIEGVSA